MLHLAHLFFAFNLCTLFAQDPIEVYIIDAYVTPETPHTFKLSFFTSEPVNAVVTIDNQYTHTVSDELTEDHAADVDFSEYKFSSKFISYNIEMVNSLGEKTVSEDFELILPYEEFIETKEGEDPISTILFGLFLYFLPAPSFIVDGDDFTFSLTKEFPLITFYSSGYTNPSGNISIEYTHVYDSNVKNYFRMGYKHFIPIDYIEYISPGVTGFTNFNGFNGVGAELSIGLFNIYDVFTVYGRYRYNFDPTETELNFNEISIGLYSHFFTIDL